MPYIVKTDIFFEYVIDRFDTKEGTIDPPTNLDVLIKNVSSKESAIALPGYFFDESGEIAIDAVYVAPTDIKKGSYSFKINFNATGLFQFEIVVGDCNYSRVISKDFIHIQEPDVTFDKVISVAEKDYT